MRLVIEVFAFQVNLRSTFLANSERLETFKGDIVKYEYKSDVIVAKVTGFFKTTVTEESCAEMESVFNALGVEGWEMTGVFPVTNGGSPAQIDYAIHHFKRQLAS